MDLRQISPDLAVSPQITPEDIPLLADAGFKLLIINRPDEEIEPDLGHEVMEDAAAKAGMQSVYLPFIPGQITPGLIEGFGEALAGPRPAIAYCRSGNRSTVLWALTNAGKMPVDEILRTAADAGYDLSGVVPLLTSLSSRNG